MSIDLERLESNDNVPGYHDGIYARNARAYDVIASQVQVEFRKIEMVNPVAIERARGIVGDDALHERARRQLAVQYDNNPRLLHRWEHEQGNMRTNAARQVGMGIG